MPGPDLFTPEVRVSWPATHVVIVATLAVTACCRLVWVASVSRCNFSLVQSVPGSDVQLPPPVFRPKHFVPGLPAPVSALLPHEPQCDLGFLLSVDAGPVMPVRSTPGITVTGSTSKSGATPWGSITALLMRGSACPGPAIFASVTPGGKVRVTWLGHWIRAVPFLRRDGEFSGEEGTSDPDSVSVESDSSSRS